MVRYVHVEICVSVLPNNHHSPLLSLYSLRNLEQRRAFFASFKHYYFWNIFDSFRAFYLDSKLYLPWKGFRCIAKKTKTDKTRPIQIHSPSNVHWNHQHFFGTGDFTWIISGNNYHRIISCTTSYSARIPGR